MRLRLAFVVPALALFFLAGAATFVDPDVWHLMALFREALGAGWIPLDDRFAYTPTVHPVVQHEWATGAILYLLATHGGLAALQGARFVLMAALGCGAVLVARRRGASTALLSFLALPAIVMSWIGLTAIRAQLLTLVLLTAWLWFLEDDRAGRRRWIPAALALHVIWANLHAGFVVGLAFLLLHAGEQYVRGRPVRHLFAVAAAMVLLVALNPYGFAYYRYLGHGLGLDRALIGEWRPLWEASPTAIATVAASLLLAVYALGRRGLQDAEGWPLLVIAAAMALRHERHVSIYALAWFCQVPALVERTPTGEVLRRVWARESRASLAAAALVLVLGAVSFARHRAWELHVPADAPVGRSLLYPYPAGAVDYLAAAHFDGNVMVPFEVGAFVSWKLYPHVKVSLDSRFEVAYPDGLLEEHLEFYEAGPGWRSVLGKYATDLVLVRRSDPVAEPLATGTGWRIAYRDDVYELFARPGISLAYGDRRGERLSGVFP